MKQEWQLRYKLFVRRERGKSVLVSGVKSAVARLEWGARNLTLGLRQMFPVWGAVASATLQSGTFIVCFTVILKAFHFTLLFRPKSKVNKRTEEKETDVSVP